LINKKKKLIIIKDLGHLLKDIIHYKKYQQNKKKIYLVKWKKKMLNNYKIMN